MWKKNVREMPHIWPTTEVHQAIGGSRRIDKQDKLTKVIEFWSGEKKDLLKLMYFKCSIFFFTI